MAKDINVDVKVTGLGDLRSQLKAAREEVVALQSADVLDPNAVAAATKRAGELRDKLNDANEQIKIMSGGTDFEKVSGGLSLIGDQLSNLDFEGAANTAKGLTTVIKDMNPQSVAKGFTDLAGTVGQLGKAFFQMGLKLLANPLFLLVAVVAAVVAAIILLKDKIKIVEQAFDILMIPIKALIQGLKDLTDWLGITSFAEDEAADKSVAASEKRIAANQKATASMDKEYARQIALAKANGKDTTALEAEQASSRQNASAQNVKLLNNDIQTLVNKQKGKTKAESEEINKQIQEKRKQRDAELEINRDSANQVAIVQANANKAADDARKKANDKAVADAKKASQDAIEAKRRALEVERIIESSRIGLLEEGLHKELATNAQKLKIQLEDLQFTKYTEEQKAGLRKVYQAEREAADAQAVQKNKEFLEQQARDVKAANTKIIEEQIAFRKSITDAQTSFDEFMLQKIGTESEKRLAAIREEYTKQRNIIDEAAKREILEASVLGGDVAAVTKKWGDIKTKLADQQAKDEAAVKDDARKAEVEKAVAHYAELASKAMELGGAINGLLNQNDTNRLNSLKSAHDAELTELDNKKQRELSQEGLSATQKDAINKKYERLKYESDLKTFKATEEIKKKQFARDKAFRIVGVIMDTASAIAKSVAASPLTFGLPWSAFSAATGALQIAAIASQKYQGEAGPSAPSTSFSTGGGGSSEPATPSTALYGKQSEANLATASESREATQNITVTAVVSETEITNTQSRVANMQRNAEL